MKRKKGEKTKWDREKEGKNASPQLIFMTTPLTSSERRTCTN